MPTSAALPVTRPSPVRDVLAHVVLSRPSRITSLTAAEGSTPASSWMQVAKTGSFVSKRYGKFSITKHDLSTMLHNFQEVTPKAPTRLPVDYDHLSMAPKALGDGVAAGWIQMLELRNNGETLWAKVEWTPDAATKIGQKEYQFTSPSFVKEHIYKDGKNIGTTLLAVAITNHPFLEGMEALTLSDGLAEVAGLSDVYTAAETLQLAAVGQRVTVTEDPEDTPFEIAEVVGVGDDAFVGLTGEDGQRLPGWYRVTELSPADAEEETDPNAPDQSDTAADQSAAAALALQKAKPAFGKEAAATKPPFGKASEKPAFGKPGFGKPGVGKGAAGPAAAPAVGGGTPDAHAAAASAHAHAASAHAGAINPSPKGFAMSTTYKLSVDGADVEITAEQLAAAGITVLAEGQTAVAAGTVETLTGQVTNLSSQVAELAKAAETNQKAAIAMELSTTLDRLSKSGRLTKPTREWALKHFGEATDLTGFREWASVQPVVISLETEHGSGSGDTEAERPPSEELLTLAQARSAQKHISLSAAVSEISREQPGLALTYREQYGDTDDSAAA
jgi:phage I-like protein